MRRFLHTHGSVEIGVLFFLAGGTLLGAGWVDGTITADGVAEHVVLYAAAVGAAFAAWKFILKVSRAIDVLFGLDRRVGKIEKHLGLAAEES